MPIINGLKAKEHIKNAVKLHPIILLKAIVTTTDIEKCKTVGMNDYI